MENFSDFAVFADESGDHGLSRIDPHYPIFVLCFCVIRKADYVDLLKRELTSLKFKYWGHDAVVLHEHEMRKSTGPFALLRTDADVRDSFFRDLTAVMDRAPVRIVASVIDKPRHLARYDDPWNPYEIALRFCLERLSDLLARERQAGKTVHVTFESRGTKEDDALEREFRRIVSNESPWGYKQRDFTPFDLKAVFQPKGSNSSGLQMADLMARPIGLNYLRPNQENRAFEVIKNKLDACKWFP